jgi:hypothetical protein
MEWNDDFVHNKSIRICLSHKRKGDSVRMGCQATDNSTSWIFIMVCIKGLDQLKIPTCSIIDLVWAHNPAGI